jgi:hypothetical protein
MYKRLSFAEFSINVMVEMTLKINFIFVFEFDR